MATTKKTTEPMTEIIPDNDVYKKKVDELTQLVEKLLAEKESTQAPSNNVQIIDTTSKMDRPCTLIHLRDCSPQLPTTIKIENKTIFLNKFGEKKMVKFSQMQEIISIYGSLFTRGILALGEDCSEFAEDLNADNVVGLPFPVEIFNKLHTMNNVEFEKFIKGLNDMQKINIGVTWMKRYVAGTTGYDDIDKLRILNRHTDSMFDDILSEVVKK